MTAVSTPDALPPPSASGYGPPEGGARTTAASFTRALANAFAAALPLLGLAREPQTAARLRRSDDREPSPFVARTPPDRVARAADAAPEREDEYAGLERLDREELDEDLPPSSPRSR